MKRMLLISGAWLGLTASIASAGGISLAWDNCLGGGGVTNRIFTCNTNVGSNDLYVSFDPTTDLSDVNGAEVVVDLQSASNPLPAWWQLKNAGSCRLTSLSAAVGPGSCATSWSGQAVAAIAAYYVTAVLPSIAFNQARILAIAAVPSTDAAPVHPGTEYTAVLIRINNAKTVGTGSCAGCLDQVCLAVDEVLLTTNNSGDLRMSIPPEYWCPGPPGTFVSWQGAPTPTQNRTWGQLKSIYR